jgi:hypothetical protein
MSPASDPYARHGLPCFFIIPAASQKNSVRALANLLFSVLPSHRMATWFWLQASRRSLKKMVLNSNCLVGGLK